MEILEAEGLTWSDLEKTRPKTEMNGKPLSMVYAPEEGHMTEETINTEIIILTILHT